MFNSEENTETLRMKVLLSAEQGPGCLTHSVVTLRYRLSSASHVSVNTTIDARLSVLRTLLPFSTGTL